MVTLGKSDYTTLVVGLVAILALSVAAATIDSAVILNPGDIDPGSGTQQGADEISPPVSNPSGPAGSGTEDSSGGATGWSLAGVPLTTCIGFLTTPFGILAALGSFFLILYGVTRTRGVRSASLAGYALGPAWFFGYFLVTDCGATGGGGGGRLFPNNPLSQGGGGGLEAPQASPLLLGGGLGAVIVLVGALLYLGMEGEEELEPPSEEESDRVRTEELAEAAGRAADRISERDVAVDNAVYRAWYEMTQILDVPNPETSTPGEFAEAAIEAGMDEETVSKLTQLFDEVRYGGRDPEEREDSALELLRHIESEYSSSDEGEDETTMNDETTETE